MNVQENREYKVKMGRSFSNRDSKFHSFRYKFKPLSVKEEKEGVIKKSTKGTEVIMNLGKLQFDGHFKDVRNERKINCVLVHDVHTNTFTLEKISSEFRFEKCKTLRKEEIKQKQKQKVKKRKKQHVDQPAIPKQFEEEFKTKFGHNRPLSTNFEDDDGSNLEVPRDIQFDSNSPNIPHKKKKKKKEKKQKPPPLRIQPPENVEEIKDQPGSPFTPFNMLDYNISATMESSSSESESDSDDD